MDALAAINTRRTPQSERADERQVPNAAGGFGFKLGDEARIHRFLSLGVDGGTYYTSERELTKANAEIVLRAAQDRGEWLVEQIVAVSTAGRAPRQNPAIFALAATSALADDPGRKAALEALPAVCRTGTHLFLFAQYVEQFRGWGRGLRRAVGNWYLDRDVDDLAYQVVKYRQREGWSHRDLLRLAHPETTEDTRLVHPETTEDTRRALFEWVCGRGGSILDDASSLASAVPAIITRFIEAQTATSADWWAALATEGLPWEAFPDAALGEAAVWRALIERGLPQTALMRQLPRLTRLGVLEGTTRTTVVQQLANPDRLRKARVHPINVLIALRTYATGHSARGEGQWAPDRQIIDALDEAFYAAFQTVQPAGKCTLIALDVSGSMAQSVSGLSISCREASAALALVTMATEPDVDIVGFTSALTELPISPRQLLDDAIRAVSNLPFGGTDCALPMVWAQQNNRKYDTVIVITDSETWQGPIHVHQALREYREKVVPNARLIVVGMTANDVSIADPQDPGSLDVAGFDSAVPTLIADFSRGDL